MDGFVFRLGSGAGRRPTTTSRTILNYYPWMTPWLIISAQLCWQPAAADSLPPVPAADLVTPRSIRHPGQEDSPAAPPTEAPYFNHLNVQIENNHGNQWSNISFAISTFTAFLLGIMCFGMMDYGHQPANAAPRWHPDGNVPFRQWMQHVRAWLNVVSARMPPAAQADVRGTMNSPSEAGTILMDQLDAHLRENRRCVTLVRRQNGILTDPGSTINIIGKETHKSFASSTSDVDSHEPLWMITTNDGPHVEWPDDVQAAHLEQPQADHPDEKIQTPLKIHTEHIHVETS